jgi:plastocyanin
MYKKVFVGLLLFAILSTALAACAIRDESGTSGPAAHMGNANFTTPSVTITKGSSLALVDDVSVEHIIVNGSWVNGKQVPKIEPGAPTVNLTFNGGDSATVGPFNTAGQFHLYCTIHPGMNLTIIVQ